MERRSVDALLPLVGSAAALSSDIETTLQRTAEPCGAGSPIKRSVITAATLNRLALSATPWAAMPP
jgi:hypothetical protein